MAAGVRMPQSPSHIQKRITVVRQCQKCQKTRESSDQNETAYECIPVRKTRLKWARENIYTEFDLKKIPGAAEKLQRADHFADACIRRLLIAPTRGIRAGFDNRQKFIAVRELALPVWVDIMMCCGALQGEGVGATCLPEKGGDLLALGT